MDDKEFQGDIISLLKNASDFVNVNSKVRWRKVATGRINKPDYAERAVFEALANAFMHRDTPPPDEYVERILSICNSAKTVSV